MRDRDRFALGAALFIGAAIGCGPLAAQQARPGSGTSPKAPIDTLRALQQAFFACFKWPPREVSRIGMEITIRFSLTRSGEVLGEPRFTFSTGEVPAETRATYQRAVADALARCTPFPLTQSFSEAVAGRPQSLRFIDTRGQRKAEL